MGRCMITLHEFPHSMYVAVLFLQSEFMHSIYVLLTAITFVRVFQNHDLVCMRVCACHKHDLMRHCSFVLSSRANVLALAK